MKSHFFERIKSHPVISVLISVVTIVTTTGSWAGTLDETRDGVNAGAKPYQALHFAAWKGGNTWSGPGEVNPLVATIQNANPGEVFYISLTASRLKGPACKYEHQAYEGTEMYMKCEEWEVPLQKCNRLNDGDVAWSPENEKEYGLDLRCSPVLFVPTEMGSGKSNVIGCDNVNAVLGGFFHIRYLRAHQGQEFYRAVEAMVDPNRANATLAEHGVTGC